MFRADRVGNIGELGGALVGGDNQVWIVAIVADDVVWMRDLAIDQIVSDVEQAVDEHLVTGDPLSKYRVALTAGRRMLDEEAALGADRHDDRVLDHLRLDQAEDFGTEILATIRPAQATACDRPKAQMHTFDARAIDPDLAIRARFGQVRHLRRIELEADIRCGLAVVHLEIVRAQRRPNHAEVGTQDTVFIQAGDVFEQFLDRRHQGFDLAFARCGPRGDQRLDELRMRLRYRGGNQRTQLAGKGPARRLDRRIAGAFALRVETGLEQFNQQSSDGRIAVERVFHVGLRERQSGLQQILAISAQHADLAPVQTRRQHQIVEAVVLGPTTPRCFEPALELLAQVGQRERQRRLGLQFEIVDGQFPALFVQRIHMFGEHAHAHVLKHRQRLGQRNRSAEMDDLEAQIAVMGIRIERHVDVVIGIQYGQRTHVGRSDLGGHLLDISGRQGPRLVRQRDALLLTHLTDQFLAQLVVPVAHDIDDLAFKISGIVFGVIAGLGSDDQMQVRQRGFANLDRGVDAFAVQRFLQHRLDALADFGVGTVARQIDQARIETSVLVATYKQTRTWTLAQRQDAGRYPRQLVVAALKQLIAGQQFQHMTQGLARMRIAAQAGTLHDRLDLAPHQRHVLRARHVGVGREQAEEALLDDRYAGRVKLQYADVVHVARPMHAGARVCLGQDDRVQRSRLRQTGGHQRAQ